MEIVLLLIIMILPICILGMYIYEMDKEKEPLKLLEKLLFGGILSCALVIAISLIMYILVPFSSKLVADMNLLELITYSFIFVGLVEEACKLLFLYNNAYNHKEFNYTFDMIVYGVFTSLGFALFENLLYITRGGLITGIARAFTAIPAHASYGVFMGMFLSEAKCYEVKNPQKSKMYKILSLIVPTLLHGLYDFFAFSNATLLLVTFIISFFGLTVMYINKKRKEDIQISCYNIE